MSMWAWLSRAHQPHRPRRRDRAKIAGASPIQFETLEKRLLLNADCPIIEEIFADNRGQIVLRANMDLQASSVSNSSVRVFRAGPDGLLGTSDDALVQREVTYDNATRTITVDANISADVRYRVLLNATLIRGTNGVNLDGEFNGEGQATGNGVAGGNLEFFTRRATVTVARFTTIDGIIDVELFQDETPLTVQNFLNYANRGDWDGTFFHRTVVTPTPFVIQGGGFTSDADFSSIPTDPPVLNEPGISNTRGTISMAKLGNQPNSATSQWFFNLGNNSGNLDNQNGGFTVFGEITNASGLTVMDTIAAHDTVNASAADPAFGEIPVVDADVFNNRGMLDVADLIIVSRIAVLVGLSGEPTGQIDPTGSVVAAHPRGDAMVRFYDLNGVGLPQDGSFFKVDFGSNNRIEKITIRDPFPIASIGIQITGANGIGSIVDTRRMEGGNIQFIVSDSQINSINLKGSILGFDLNGFVLPDGITLPDDVDDDGQFNDLVAIWTGEGVMQSLSVKGDLIGGVAIMGGLMNVKIQGHAIDADFNIGQGDLALLRTNLTFTRATDTDVRAESQIGSLTAQEWKRDDPARVVIEADAINTLKLTGDKRSGLDGDFDADVRIRGVDENTLSLGRVIIPGVLLEGRWNVEGDTGPITVRGDISQTSIEINGNVPSIQTGRILASDIIIGGTLGNLRAREWFGGDFGADSVRQLQITGGEGSSGDFEANVTVPHTSDERFAIGLLDVAGVTRSATFDVDGPVKRLNFRGDVEHASIDIAGDLSRFTAKRAFESDLIVNGIIQRATVTRWDNGELQALELVAFSTTGDRRNGITGDYFGDIAINTIGSFSIADHYQGEFRGNTAQSIRIGGNLMQSTMIFQANLGTDMAIESLVVGGMMEFTTLHVRASVGNVVLKGMIESGIYVGTNDSFFGLPDNATGVTLASTLQSISIQGFGPDDQSMFNGFIVAGTLGTANIQYPNTDNFGRPFGIATGELDRVEVRHANGRLRLGPNSGTPDPIQDFEVRIGFIPPTQA